MYWMDGKEGGGWSEDSAPQENLHLQRQSKRLSVDREGLFPVPMVCGLAIMHCHGCLAYPPTFMRVVAAHAGGSRGGDRELVSRS